jgi:hypothetical protein
MANGDENVKTEMQKTKANENVKTQTQKQSMIRMQKQK